nr:unnamed protein product [Callosobruchus chinensis]
MKFFVAALSALLAIASAVPIYDVAPTYMGGDMMGINGMYNPMHMLWAGIGGISNTGMGVYSPLYHNYGLMGIGNSWGMHQSMGMKNWYPSMLDSVMLGGGLVGDMYTRELVNPMMMTSMLHKSGWTTVDKMACYHRYGIERCHVMMMHRMMPHMMLANMMY